MIFCDRILKTQKAGEILFRKKEKNKIVPFFFKTVDSTGNIARKTAKAGADEGTTIIAEAQTAGRGRLGRTFLSAKGGIYMSIVLRPKISPKDTLFITVAAAVAAARAIESVCDKKCEIKWVNDIYIQGKKVCGILTEGEFDAAGNLDFAILGVGINLFEPKDGFSADIPLAGSVFDKKSKILSKNKIKRQTINLFVKEFFAFYENILQKEFMTEYQTRSFLTGKKITYTKNEKTYTAEVVGIDNDANLLVKSDNKTEKLSHGEIQIVGMEQPPI